MPAPVPAAQPPAVSHAIANCGSCTYFGADNGCHRYPPASGTGKFHPMLATDWCGEFLDAIHGHTILSAPLPSP